MTNPEDKVYDALNELHDIRQMNEERYKERVEELEEQNAQLLKALESISKPEGVYSRDELTHARNTIENMMSIANTAIASVEGKE